MAVQLDLHEGETIIKEVKGDYWEKLFLFMYSQKRGKYWFTSERIIFRGGIIAGLDLPYAEIAEISKCNVGPAIHFIPTGIKVTMKDGKQYRLSVLGRKEIMEIIQSKL